MQNVDHHLLENLHFQRRENIVHCTLYCTTVRYLQVTQE
jgi:hypothetical protein